jgi:hypothetical protein
MTVVDEKVRSSAYAVELRATAPLIRAIKNAMVCAGKDDTLPVLRAVQFHFSGTTLEVRSTDRFLMLLEQVAGVEDSDDAPKSAPFRLLLPYAACQQALVFLKSVPKGHPATLSWTPRNPQDASDWNGGVFEQGTLCLRSYEGSVELTAIEGEGPKLHALVPDAAKPIDTSAIGLSRHTAQAISKIEPESRHGYFRVSLYGPTKPLRLDWAEERRTLLVMPVKTLQQSDWGVPGL